MAEGLDNVRIELEKAQLEVAMTQLAVIKEFKSSVNKELGGKFKNLKKDKNKLSLSSLQAKLSSVFSNAAKTLTKPFKSIGSAFSNVGSKISGVFKNFNPFGALKGFLNIKSKVGGVKEGAAKLFGKDTETMRKKYYALWSNPRKVEKLLTKSIKHANKGKATGGKAASGGGGSISDSISGGVGEILHSIAKAINKISTAVSFFFAGPGLGIALAIGLTPPVLIICAALYFIIKMLINAITTLLTPIIDVVAQILDKVINAILPVVEQILVGVSGVLESIFGILQQVFGLVGDIVKSIADIVTGILKPIVGIVNKIGEIILKIWDLIGSIFDTILSAVTELLPPIKDAIVAMEPVITHALQSIIMIMDKIATLANIILDKIISFLSSPVAAAAKVGKSVVSAVGGLKDAIMGEPTDPTIKAIQDIKMTMAPGVTILGEIHKKLSDFYDLYTKYLKLMLLGGTNTFNKYIDTQIYQEQTANKNKEKTLMNTGFIDLLKNREQQKIETDAEIDKPKTLTVSEINAVDNNPFAKLTESFNKMQKESILVLNQIKDAVLTISSSRIKIANTEEAGLGTARITDNSNMVQMPSSMTMNTDEELKSNLKTIIQNLNVIAKNTSITEEGKQKKGAGGGGLWSLFG